MTVLDDAREPDPEALWIPGQGVGRPRAVPRFATQRNPRRETHGPKVCKVMELLGHAPMPWQRRFLDVSLELLNDDEGGPGYAYDEPIAIVTRQSGKTAMELGVVLQRSLGHLAPTLSSYTCQSKKEGLIKFMDDQLPLLMRSPFWPLMSWRGSHGMEQLRFDNGSQLEILPPTKDAGHGRSRDLAWVDEAWDLRSWDVEQGLKPAMITRSDWAQYWVSSTVGDFMSLYLNEKMELGRRSVEVGLDRGICYLEYSAAPTDDPTDPDVWWRTMPALGYTQTEEGIAAMLAGMELDEFCRAFLNIPRARRQSVAIAPSVWAATEGADRITGREVWALSTGVERSSASLVRAGWTEAGVAQLVVMENRPGVGWVPGVLADKVPGGTIVLDRFLDGSMIPDLERAGLEVRQLGTPDVINAYAKLIELLKEGKAQHARQAVLDDAAANATTRPVRGGDGALFKRMGAIDISPLVAASLALWALVSEPPPKPRLKVVN